MSEMEAREAERKRRNPGWAGETGDFEELTEADVRGTAYSGERPKDGGHPGAAPSAPYMRVERDPDSPLFEGEYGERLEKILSRYPEKQPALLPVLNLAQEIRGHLSPETMEEVARVLDLAPAYVRGVATFYTMYNKRPVGRHFIQVCTNVGCNLCGADDVLEAFLDHTDTEPGQVSDDGLFTVMEVECLGACGFPTVVQINDAYYENVAPDDVPAILDRLRSETPAGIGAADSPAPAEPDPAAQQKNGRGRGPGAEQGNGGSPSPGPGAGSGEEE